MHTDSVWHHRDQGSGRAVECDGVLRKGADFDSNIHRELQCLRILEDVMLMEVWDNESADNSSGDIDEYRIQGNMMQNF